MSLQIRALKQATLRNVTFFRDGCLNGTINPNAPTNRRSLEVVGLSQLLLIKRATTKITLL